MIHYTITSVTNQRDCVTLSLLQKTISESEAFTLYMIHYTITSVTNQRDCVTHSLLQETISELEALYFIYDTLHNTVSDEIKSLCYTFTST